MKRIIKSITIDEEVAKEIEKRCKEENRTFSNYVESVLKKELKKQKIILKGYLERVIIKMNKYFINIYDKTTDKSWCENFDSYYLFRKRYTKLKYSKKLVVVSHSNLIDQKGV